MHHQNPCQHSVSDACTFSGDLICSHCGQVLQTNAQISLEAPFQSHQFDRDNSGRITPLISHQERSEQALSALTRKLISAFALKPGYQAEASQLLHRYWTQEQCKQRYGQLGNRMLVAALFLLARRDHLAVNLGVLAAAIDASVQECGTFIEPLIKLEPSLRVLAKVSDFVERSLDLLLTELQRSFHLALLDPQIHTLHAQIDFVANLIQDEERGASKSAESSALAATWIVLEALIQESKLEEKASIALSAIESSIGILCESSKLSLKTVKLKHVVLLDKLQERASILLPGTFSLKLTKKQRKFILLDNLASITAFPSE